jgi:hypothetical protein
MSTAVLINLALDAVFKGIELVSGMIAKAKQDAELTPEQETQIRGRQQELIRLAPHWQIDPDPVPPVEPS